MRCLLPPPLLRLFRLLRLSSLCALTPLLGLGSAAAWADPGYCVMQPDDNEGLRTVDFQLPTSDFRLATCDFRNWAVKREGYVEGRWPEVGLGLGVTSRWTTELFVSWLGSSQLATKQTDLGRWRLNGNVFFERAYGNGPVLPSQIKCQWQVAGGRWQVAGGRWQVAYRMGPVLGLGAQGFGELGRWNRWSPQAEQSNRAGPMISGNWPLSDAQTGKATGGRAQFTLPECRHQHTGDDGKAQHPERHGRRSPLLHDPGGHGEQDEQAQIDTGHQPVGIEQMRHDKGQGQQHQRAQRTDVLADALP